MIYSCFNNYCSIKSSFKEQEATAPSKGLTERPR